MTKPLKFLGLSTLERLTSSSTLEERETPFPIASVSKSFCGAVCALMAVDRKFGDSGIDATLEEVLQSSKTKYPDRAENIDQYLKMLENRGFLDVKISELLNHRSGCKAMTPKFYNLYSF